MKREHKKHPKDKVEFLSYTEYLNNLYPNELEKETLEEESTTFGTKLAEESLQLMSKLLSEKKISCIRT